jgi:hypothetical protein
LNCKKVGLCSLHEKNIYTGEENNSFEVFLYTFFRNLTVILTSVSTYPANDDTREIVSNFVSCPDVTVFTRLPFRLSHKTVYSIIFRAQG